MGIVNVTPDSFSDGGRFFAPETAVARGRQMADEGARILDIGGESTRPGADAVSPEEEMRRVIPVLEGLKGCGAVVSVDTRHAATMAAALAAGAGMINDVTALTGDPQALAVVAGHPDCRICLMHMQGAPRTMQQAPVYRDVVSEVYDYLAARIDVCEKAGIAKSRLVADPGIGFGKTLAHNLALLQNLSVFQELGVPVMLGVSRKSFIDHIVPGSPPDQRLPGSLAAALWGAGQGAAILRVHDVRETAQALEIWNRLNRSR